MALESKGLGSKINHYVHLEKTNGSLELRHSHCGTETDTLRHLGYCYYEKRVRELGTK